MASMHLRLFVVFIGLFCLYLAGYWRTGLCGIHNYIGNASGIELGKQIGYIIAFECKKVQLNSNEFQRNPYSVNVKAKLVYS